MELHDQILFQRNTLIQFSWLLGTEQKSVIPDRRCVMSSIQEFVRAQNITKMRTLAEDILVFGVQGIYDDRLKL